MFRVIDPLLYCALHKVSEENVVCMLERMGECACCVGCFVCVCVYVCVCVCVCSCSLYEHNGQFVICEITCMLDLCVYCV